MRMKRYFIFAVFVLIVLGASLAAANDSPNSFFLRGNYLYEQGEYKDAIDRYEEIVKAGFASPEVFYNLANACFKDGQLGRAILNYERALMLSPRDKDIKNNLDIAEGKIKDKIQLPGRIFIQQLISNIHNSFTINDQLLFISWLISLLTLFLIFSIYNIKSRRIIIFVVGILVFLLICISISCAFKIYEREKIKRAVVITPKIKVRSGPGEQYSIQFEVHEGTIFKIVKTFNNWLEVYISGDLRGWVKEEDLEVIWPVK